MLGRSRRRGDPAGGRGWRPRHGLTGCLLWILGLVVVLIILSLLFGGFQMGTKAAGAAVPLPVHAVLAP
jgi:hypothetical protein